MNITNVKGLAGKGTLAALAMGALFIAGAASAQAQVAFGVQVGAPAYVYPQATYYGAPGYRDRYAYSRQEQREAIIRHEEWEHARHLDHRFDDRRAFRDDRRSDHRWR